MKILVIPDAHAHPDYDNERFSPLGKFILDTRPDAVVCLGDFWDMPSLCRHTSRRDAEAMRLASDLRAGTDAMDRLMAPILDFNARARKNRKPRYEPRMVFCLGNHENRLDGLVAESPVLEGVVSLDSFLVGHGWEVHPYRQMVEVGGAWFCHEFPAGVSGRAIGGKTMTTRMLGLHESCVAGHSHTWGLSEDAAPSGRKVTAIVAGCYSHPGQQEGWNRNTTQLWWYGATVLRVNAGHVLDVLRLSADTISARYP